jgi:hypothetical protein
MEELNIVDLIENNPITKLSQNYNGKLLSKIKNVFSDFEQQLFVTSFYCYLNYNQKTDFVIDLDNIWKWLGFQQKVNAKNLLEKHFTADIDYIKSLLLQQKQTVHIKGGQNKEIFMLNIKTFKLFCIKSGTKKADEIHEYFIKMEEILQDTIQEESSELKLQLENKQLQLEQSQNKINNHEQEKDLLLEQTLILQFPINTECIYYGKIDNITGGNEKANVIKFGQSNNLAERIKCHKKNFLNFRLIAAFKVKNKIQIENAIKKHPILKKRLRILTVENPNYKDENYREILAIDNDKFSIEKIDEYIKQIIVENEYNIENYNLLVGKNEQLEEQLRVLQQENKDKDDKLEKMSNELQNFKSDTLDSKKPHGNLTICKYSYYLYAFECSDMQYKCSIVRQKDVDLLITNLTQINTNGSMKYKVKVLYPFSEKIMAFIIKQNMSTIGLNMYEGSYENIKKVLDITVKIEKMLIENSKDLDVFSDMLDGIKLNTEFHIDPTEPTVHKAKIQIDQINNLTGEVIATFNSLEEAGKSVGCTGTAIGIANRTKRVCKGFRWRPTGVSKEQQYDDQPVIKVCCSTGKQTLFSTIADAAKDAIISAPGLRSRILTKVHTNGHHWIFGKNASHYSSF